MYVSCDCCMLSGRGLSDGLIPCPEKSYGLTVIESDQVQQWHATLILVKEVRLSKKELVFIVIIHWCCHHCWSSLFRWFRSSRMWPCSYMSGSQSFEILWCPHFQGKQSSWTVCSWGRDHGLLTCHKQVTSTHRHFYIFLFLLTSCPVSSVFSFPSLICIISMYWFLCILVFPYSAFRNTWRFRDTIQNIHFLVAMCLRCNFLHILHLKNISLKNKCLRRLLDVIKIKWVVYWYYKVGKTMIYVPCILKCKTNLRQPAEIKHVCQGKIFYS
jgi:hypothetical protein